MHSTAFNERMRCVLSSPFACKNPALVSLNHSTWLTARRGLGRLWEFTCTNTTLNCIHKYVSLASCVNILFTQTSCWLLLLLFTFRCDMRARINITRQRARASECYGKDCNAAAGCLAHKPGYLLIQYVWKAPRVLHQRVANTYTRAPKKRMRLRPSPQLLLLLLLLQLLLLKLFSHTSHSSAQQY